MFKLYKKTGKNLENKKEVDLKPTIFKNEDEMKNWIADNLSKLLPSLLFLKMEHFIGKKYLDILALDPQKSTFVIIECKLYSESKIDQLIGYTAKIRNASENENKKLRGIAWDKYYSAREEYEAMDLEFYSFKETKIILISPHFEDWVIELAKETKSKSIILAKIGAYEFKGDNFIYLDIEGKEGEKLLGMIDISREKKEKNQSKILKPEPKEWEEWAKQEVVFLKKICPLFTNSKWRHKINIKKHDETVLSIYYKSSFVYNPLKKLTLFLVNPTSLLVKKFNLQKQKQANTYKYLVDTKKQNGFQEAHLLIVDFLKQKM